MIGLHYLDVPFGEKDQAKACGARWNPTIKHWFAPDEEVWQRCSRWHPRIPEKVEIVAFQSVHIVCGSTACHRCKASCDFAALAARYFQVCGDIQQDCDIRIEDEFQAFSNLTGADEEVTEAIAKAIPSYRLARSKTAGQRYFMNHCTSCNATQGDFFQHSEPGGLFCQLPWDPPRPLEARATIAKGKIFLQARGGGFSSRNMLHEQLVGLVGS